VDGTRCDDQLVRPDDAGHREAGVVLPGFDLFGERTCVSQGAEVVGELGDVGVVGDASAQCCEDSP
jgi:hypothetical protein